MSARWKEVPDNDDRRDMATPTPGEGGFGCLPIVAALSFIGLMFVLGHVFAAVWDAYEVML